LNGRFELLHNLSPIVKAVVKLRLHTMQKKKLKENRIKYNLSPIVKAVVELHLHNAHKF
jgi:hypothetical protein